MRPAETEIPTLPDNTSPPSTKGYLCAFGAYGLWGVIPVYFKITGSVSAVEVLLHRIIWSFVLLIAVMTIMGGWKRLIKTLKNPKVPAILALTSALVCVNWFTFIYAVQVDRINEASLGYFINPLVNIGFGMLLLRERLRSFQKAALVLAVIAVTFLTISEGTIPWLALIMAFSFSIYGLLRKVISAEATEGFFVETAFAVPFALGGLIFFQSQGTLWFLNHGVATDIALISAGWVTTIPLVLFAMAARRLPYSMMGFIQYLCPTMHLLLAVFVYGETLKPDRLFGFILIWTGLALISFDAIRSGRRSSMSRGKNQKTGPSNCPG